MLGFFIGLIIGGTAGMFVNGILVGEAEVIVCRQ